MTTETVPVRNSAPLNTRSAITPATRAPGARKRRQRKEALAGYGFLLPWIIGFVCLTLGPMIVSLYLAFTSYNLFRAPEWIGLDNFQRMLSDHAFHQSVQITLTYVLVGTPIKLAAALGVALLLNFRDRGAGFFRSAFYAPSLIGASVAIAIVWRALFRGDGPVDEGLSLFGINLGGWVGNPSLVLPMMIILSVWQFGAPMVIFLAGLKQVPTELYEAAQMDGAGAWRKFRNVTLPMLSPVIFFNLLLETIHAFQIFGSAYVISSGTGGPAGMTNFYTVYLYKRGFSDLQMGYASAMAWVLLVVIGLIAFVFFRTSKSWVHYAGDTK